MCVSPRRLLSRISSREVSRKSFFPKCLIVLLICLVEVRILSIILDYFLHQLILKNIYFLDEDVEEKQKRLRITDTCKTEISTKMLDTIAHPAGSPFVTGVNQEMDPLKIFPRAITMKSAKHFDVAPEQNPKEIVVAILKSLKRNRELMKMMPSLPKAEQRILICYYQKGKMLQQKRPFLCSTTSRTAAPLGDPRGVPKLFRKCSLKLKRLSTTLSIQDLQSLKIQDLENLVTFLNTSAEAKPECLKVNIGIVIMSGVILGNELPNELLKLLGDFDTEVSSEDGRYVLPALELETFLNMNNSDDYGAEDSINTNTNGPLSDTTSVSFDTFESRGSSQVSPATDQAQHTELETVWRMSPPAPPPLTILDTGGC